MIDVFYWLLAYNPNLFLPDYNKIKYDKEEPVLMEQRRNENLREQI